MFDGKPKDAIAREGTQEWVMFSVGDIGKFEPTPQDAFLILDTAVLRHRQCLRPLVYQQMTH